MNKEKYGKVEPWEIDVQKESFLIAFLMPLVLVKFLLKLR
jgi:hypothetical protein